MEYNEFNLEQFMLGAILGDGSFLKDGRLSIAHSDNQAEWCTYKHSFLNNYNLVGKLSENTIYNDRYKNGYIKEVRFKTKRNDKFQKVRSDLYVDGKKRITEEYLHKLDAFGLAIWYQDDGYVSKNSCFICTMRYNNEEMKMIQEYMFNKFGVKTTTNQRNELYILAESLHLFRSIIEPFVIPTLAYKLVSYSQRKES